MRNLSIMFKLIVTVLAMGISGRALAGWSSMESGTASYLMDVWGSSATDVYAVGLPILHYDGSTWLQVDSGATGIVHYDIFGSSANNIFTVGWHFPVPYNGFFRHYNGTFWTPLEILTPEPL